MLKHPVTFFSIFFITLCAGRVAAETYSWPQWRGPDRSNISHETGLLRNWPAEGLRRVWLFENCGVGYSGPAIVDGRLFTMGGRDNAETVLCLDCDTGSEIWSAPVGEILENEWGNGPRSTPTVHDGRVYALGGQGNLVCLETANGEELWRISLTELGGSIPTWGYTESVLVDGDSVVCTPGGPAGAVVAVHRRTGHVLWRSTDFTEDAQYTSIVPIDHNGQRQYVQLTQKSLVGLDAQTGRIAWRTDWLGNVAVVPTPIVHQGYVYATAGYGAGCILFQLGDGSSVTSVYDDQAKKAMKNHHGGVLLFEDHIYGYSDGVGWVCQEFLSGKIVWRERSKFGKGSIGFADGMLYLLSEDDGTVVLIDASPHGWNEKGRFTLQPQSKIRKREGRIWVHPVVCNGRLFLRDQDLVYCYDVSAK